MRQNIKLFELWGIPIGINQSWFILFVFVTGVLAVGYLPTAYAEFNIPQYWVLAIVSALLLTLSVLFHELAHAYFAQRDNLEVTRITLFFLGGVAELKAEPRTAENVLKYPQVKVKLGV